MHDHGLSACIVLLYQFDCSRILINMLYSLNIHVNVELTVQHVDKTLIRTPWNTPMDYQWITISDVVPEILLFIENLD